MGNVVLHLAKIMCAALRWRIIDPKMVFLPSHQVILQNSVCNQASNFPFMFNNENIYVGEEGDAVDLWMTYSTVGRIGC